MPVDLADVIAGEAANALREIGALAGVPSTVDVLLHLPDLVDWVRATAERAATVRVVTADRDALAAEVDARIADAVAAERHAMGVWLRNPKNWGEQNIARAIEHGDHIDDDAPPLPSLRMVMLARDELLRQVETLTAERDKLSRRVDVLLNECDTSALDEQIEEMAARIRELEAPGECQSLHKLRAERDRRIDPVEHARAVRDAFVEGAQCYDGDGIDRAEVIRSWADQCDGYDSKSYATLLARVGADVLAEVER